MRGLDDHGHAPLAVTHERGAVQAAPVAAAGQLREPALASRSRGLDLHPLGEHEQPWSLWHVGVARLADQQRPPDTLRESWRGDAQQLDLTGAERLLTGAAVETERSPR